MTSLIAVHITNELKMESKASYLYETLSLKSLPFNDIYKKHHLDPYGGFKHQLIQI